MQIHDLVPVIQLSVSPVILIFGVGLILLSMVNRYGHIIDKARHLSSILRSDITESSHIRAQLRIMHVRAYQVRLAIIFAIVSLLLATVLISALFVICLLHIEAALAIVVLFISCILSLSIALIVFLADINMSLKALTLEIESHPQEG
jgi:hypothetical protein